MLSVGISGRPLGGRGGDEGLVQVKVQQGRGEAGTAQHPEVGLERERVLVVAAARVYEAVGELARMRPGLAL